MLLATEPPDEQLDTFLKKFWEMEELSERATISPDDEWVEDNFRSTYQRDTSGRYVVTIPINPHAQSLGSTRAVAMKRFFQLEQRLRADHELKEKYVSFMREYEQMGHMVRATRSPPAGETVYYIPHHCVSKKFRVVFDASCKSSNGTSLNDVQFHGARLQDDLAAIITRFRTYKVAVNADVRKMFRQVRVDPEQWDLQRIFWREDPNQELREYWLTVVTYGMASSSFNAVRAMIQCASDHKGAYPLAYEAITKNFYMDDMLTGADTEQEALQLTKEIIASLSAGGFELDKFTSSSAQLLSALVGKENHHSEHILPEEITSSILGLIWDSSTDEIPFKVHLDEEKSVMTKRAVVSAIARLYDPNGYLAPVIIRAKIIIQDLWRSRAQWNEPIPSDILPVWQQFQHELSHLTSVRVPRWLGSRRANSLELHGFADASERAYAAVVYLLSRSSDSETRCILVASKTRVAPLKTVTIPRLELSAANLLCKLMVHVVNAGMFQHLPTTYWSDSMVVLHWITKLPFELKTFVANRVKSIQELSGSQPWRHVSSGDNPADLGSRGMSAVQLSTSDLWWHGPQWLVGPAQDWPRVPTQLSAKQQERAAREEKPLIVSNLTVKRAEGLSIMGETIPERKSTLRGMLRVTALVQRFIRNCRARNNLEQLKPATSIPLVTAEEREQAMFYWVQRAQEEAYTSELKQLSKGEPIDSTSSILTLSPFKDQHGILRVGGRLDKSLLPYDTKHPMVLPSWSRLSELLFKEAHLITKHGGIQICMQYIRQQFWIPGLRRALKTYIGRCVICFRQKSKVAEQMMGSLPQDRVQPARPFKHSGVDYAGPVQIKARAGRSKIMEKGYVAVFVCMVTRAIHLELVSSQTTEAFLAAFQRFTGRRGACSVLWSDNATTFVGADRELRRSRKDWEHILPIEQMNNMGTEWKFIIPGAPHTGGIWEAGVKSLKYHLRRLMGKHVFTFETLATMLVQIEACLNSRPLSALSDDPADLCALTPGHFLIGEQILQPLRADVSEIPQNRLKLWATINQMQQHFWKRWHNEYLNTLQQRFKWNQQRENIKIGDLVIIREENTPPTVWSLGRITAVHPGADGLVRSADVRTEHTTLSRPVQKLCILPKDKQSENN